MIENTGFPPFAEELKFRYLAGEAVLFVLHSNVKDLACYENEYLPLKEFLFRSLLEKTKEVVIYYDPSEGVTFATPAMKKQFFKVLNARQALYGEAPIDALSVTPGRILPILENFLLIPGQKVGLIISYAETIVPAGELSFMTMEERATLVTIQRWASDPKILHSDNIIMLITENLVEMNGKIVKNPQIIPIELPLPNEKDRLEFIDYLQKKDSVSLDIKPQILAEITSGLRRIQINGIFRQAKKSNKPVSFDLVKNKKKEIIENECFGLVELVEPTFTLEHVGGMESTKKVLNKVVKAIKEGDRRSVPMGIFFVGPMGTGKTFLAEAFAGESGLTCIKMKNFREKWVGSTEANLEKILNIVKALGSVIIIIDEVDRALSGSESEGDSGTSSRVYAKIKAFMSDTAHRGKILWIIMSNRPDKIDIDLKRPGRFDLKIPFFFPQTNEEREAIFKALFKKNKIEYELTDLNQFLSMLEGYSGAEIEAIVLLSVEFAKEQKSQVVKDEHLKAAIEDFIPNRNKNMIEFMELLAVFECSSKRMLPSQYQDINNQELSERLRLLKKLVW